MWGHFGCFSGLFVGYLLGLGARVDTRFQYICLMHAGIDSSGHSGLTKKDQQFKESEMDSVHMQILDSVT